VRACAIDARPTVHESFATRFFEQFVGASKRGVDAREGVETGRAGKPTFTFLRVERLFVWMRSGSVVVVVRVAAAP
jgi:hypothetical protein